MAYNEGGSSGNLILIQSQTASASTQLTFTTGITFNEYVLRYNNVTASVDGSALYMTLSTDGGNTYLNAGYISNVFNFRMDSAGIGLAAEATTVWYLSQVVNSAKTQSGQYFLSNMLIGNPGINGQITPFTSGFDYGSITMGYQTTGNINALKIFPSGGNLATGTFKLYGVQN